MKYFLKVKTIDPLMSLSILEKSINSITTVGLDPVIIYITRGYRFEIITKNNIAEVSLHLKDLGLNAEDIIIYHYSHKLYLYRLRTDTLQKSLIKTYTLECGTYVMSSNKSNILEYKLAL